MYDSCFRQFNNNCLTHSLYSTYIYFTGLCILTLLLFLLLFPLLLLLLLNVHGFRLLSLFPSLKMNLVPPSYFNF